MRLDGDVQGSSATTAGEGDGIDPDVLLHYGSERDVDAPPTLLGIRPRLRSGTVVYAGAVIGDRFSTGHHVVIRERVRIGDDVAVWTGSVVDYGCVLGDRVKVHAGCYVAQNSRLEDGAFLAPGVVLANDLYPGDPDSAQHLVGPVIGAGAQIGAGARVLPGVRVGRRALVGAGAVVTRDIPPGVVAYGCPAVPTRPVADLPPITGRVAGMTRTRSSSEGSSR